MSQTAMLEYAVDAVKKTQEQEFWATDGSTISHSVNADLMTKEEIMGSIERGYQDYLAGRYEPADKVFARLRIEYGI